MSQASCRSTLVTATSGTRMRKTETDVDDDDDDDVDDEDDVNEAAATQFQTRGGFVDVPPTFWVRSWEGQADTSST